MEAKKLSDPRKFAAIKRRWLDIIRNHGEDIKENNFLRFASGTVCKEIAWLIKEVERLAKREEIIPDEPTLADEEPLEPIQPTTGVEEFEADPVLG